ncbi:hypothetical protein N1851_020337 [Merluccius polli]|uniref:Uncharacterized protein n=1 Tax=Merluccius polli TaxID=89951 RepID=A0AA47NYY7_MERPO|nr:hypothetical protein N1851_020337 [Merluccius polli]
MEQSPLAAILGHLTQMSDRQTQLQRTQNEVLLELGQSLTADRASEVGGGGLRQSRRMNHLPPPSCRRAIRRQGRGVGVGVDQRERETVPWRASGDESPESQATVLWTPRCTRRAAADLPVVRFKE